MPKTSLVPQEVSRLQWRIIDEICFAFGFSRNGFIRRIIGPLFTLPARHFARIVARYQAMVPQIGFGLTAREALSDFNTRASITGEGCLPTDGPLIVASNHIGGVDTLAVASCILRPDLKIMVSDVGFLRSMSIADDSFIFVPPDAPGRMSALHQAIQHLQASGAVLVFAHGEVEPDPAVLPGARESLEEWSPSLEIMLRKVPSAQLQIVLMSGAIHPVFMRSPLVHLRKTLFARQKLAEFLQIMQQMIFPHSLETHIRVSLSEPMGISELGTEKIMPAIIQHAKSLLDEHLQM